MIMKLWALWALAGTASALLPVIVPMSDNANDTQLTWGPVKPWRFFFFSPRGRRSDWR